jgi:hypothetical protein
MSLKSSVGRHRRGSNSAQVAMQPHVATKSLSSRVMAASARTLMPESSNQQAISVGINFFRAYARFFRIALSLRSPPAETPTTLRPLPASWATLTTTLDRFLADTRITA